MTGHIETAGGDFGFKIAPVAAAFPPVEGRLYAPGPFDRIEVDGSGQIRLAQSDRDEVFVPGDERAQSRVDLHVSHGRLTVTLPGSWKFWSGGKALVEVHMRSIGHITVSGAADVLAPGPVSGPRLGVELSGAGLVRLDDLRVGELAFDISGAGEGQLAGQVDRLRLGVSGKGRVTADQLRARSADVSISGVGNAELWVTEALSVDISGAGRVGYWGHPRVQQDIDGFGAVDVRVDNRLAARLTVRALLFGGEGQLGAHRNSSNQFN